jgi:alkylation response protein AidB-like acyl-CoA dehydrogenase
MNFQLTQEQEMLVDAVRSFVAKELLPHEEAVDRADEVSPSSPRRFAARPSPRASTPSTCPKRSVAAA